MRVFIENDMATRLGMADRLDGVIMLGGQPIAEEKGQQTRFLAPKFFQDFEEDGVVTPKFEAGTYILNLTSDDGDDIVAVLTPNGWGIRMGNADHEAEVNWFESFLG